MDLDLPGYKEKSECYEGYLLLFSGYRVAITLAERKISWLFENKVMFAFSFNFCLIHLFSELLFKSPF